jgi:3-deoxy-D-manno-octulosonic-acid transferase
MQTRELRLNIYQKFMQTMGFLFDSRIKGTDGDFCSLFEDERPSSPINKPVVWVHAASAGELEGLESLAIALANRGYLIQLTVFSVSGKNAYLKLRKKLRELNAWYRGGLSPFEGGWSEAFEKGLYQCIVTAKYEAWPDFWANASLHEVSVFILGAQKRPSIILADWVTRIVLGVRRPHLVLAAYSEKDARALKSLDWEKSDIIAVRDPRWDKIFESVDGAIPSRAESILKWAQSVGFSRPWGMIGNSWTADFKALPSLAAFEFMGKTLWVIPHEVDGKELLEQERYLKFRGWEVLRLSKLNIGEHPATRGAVMQTSREATQAPGENRNFCILVDEVGVLRSLYVQADFVYVGGGFGKGIHSVMEPVIGGASIIAGPRGASRFVEVEQLLASGDLHLVSSDRQLVETVLSIKERGEVAGEREAKKAAHKLRQGGTIDVLSALFRT